MEVEAEAETHCEAEITASTKFGHFYHCSNFYLPNCPNLPLAWEGGGEQASHGDRLQEASSLAPRSGSFSGMQVTLLIKTTTIIQQVVNKRFVLDGQSEV